MPSCSNNGLLVKSAVATVSFVGDMLRIPHEIFTCM